MRHSKLPSTQLFWQTLQEESSGLPAKSILIPPTGDGEDIDGRVLRVLEEAGGSATLFEVDVRTGVPRQRSHRAVNRLARQGLVTQERRTGKEVVLRLSPQARQLALRSRGHKPSREEQQP